MERVIITQNEGETFEEFKERVDLKRGILKLKHNTKVTMKLITERRGRNENFLNQFSLRIHLKL